VIPVFSLRSEGSFGIGDFGDLKLMIDWAAKTGQRIIQVLPINDTTMTHTWQDSYPYNAISIYALHPQYTDIRQLPELKDEQRRVHFEQLRQELNSLPEIDYELVNKAKLDYLHELFVQERENISNSVGYARFFDENKEWLVPYAQFCVNRDTYGTADFRQWPEEVEQQPSTADSQQQFWYFVQYHLDCQMRAAHDYARLQHIILKGDIPIGISRDGVEAWVEPKYFNMNGQAGAPPDEFAADGQNWGFPTYNWDEMLLDGCQWWVRRFRKMQQYFDAYRIDHVLGFFRIWEIPMPEKSGLMGQFAPALGLSRQEIEDYGIYGHDDLFLIDHKRSDRWHPRIAVQSTESYHRLNDWEKQQFDRLYNDYFYRRNNQFWYEEAMKKLPRLTQATRMLACAEDLGMVPDCVGWVMKDLRILTLEIQSMPKDNTVRFGQLYRNPYPSVCTISTHDMPTLRQWWDENHERAQSFYNEVLSHDDLAPHPMPGWLARQIVCQHLASPSMLCLLSLQDWLATDESLRHSDPNSERINIPANPRHYWRWRMHLNIEQLLQADNFNEEISTLIVQSGRK
jgi:4-alpha-glucanotransferase